MASRPPHSASDPCRCHTRSRYGVRPGGSDTCTRSTPMDFSLTEAQQEIRDAILKVCAGFGDDYWLERDHDGAFPHAFHRAIADGGWLGIAMPEAYGGSGLGITEAAVMMQAIAESGAAFSGASALHMNIFGLNPVVLFGTAEQKARFLPPLIARVA